MRLAHLDQQDHKVRREHQETAASQAHRVSQVKPVGKVNAARLGLRVPLGRWDPPVRTEGRVPLELLVWRDLMETEVHRDLVDSRDFAASRARQEHKVMLPLIEYTLLFTARNTVWQHTAPCRTSLNQLIIHLRILF